jgi:hypothetical protein
MHSGFFCKHALNIVVFTNSRVLLHIHTFNLLKNAIFKIIIKQHLIY